jgi:hypothetical protein
MHGSVDVRHHRFTARLLARFKQFFHARQTVRDVAASRYTPRVERAQRQLRARLTDRLRSHHADR